MPNAGQLTPKGQRTRERIVDAAAGLMLRQGFAATTLDDVKAAACGAGLIIAPPSLWAVFQTYYGGFIVLFLVVFAGLVVTMAPASPARR